MNMEVAEVESAGPALAFELKKLSPTHKQVAALLAQGVARKTIADAMDYTPEYVTMLQRQPLFMEYVREMSAAAGTRLEAMFTKSVDVIADAMVNGNAEEQLRAAKLQMEATGRVGRYQTPAREEGGQDKLLQLSERLVDLLHRQRSRTYEVEDAQVIRTD